MKDELDFLKGFSAGKLFNRIEVITILSEYKKKVLNDYTDYLLKAGYCDTDVYSEPPSAIDRFLHKELR